MQNTSTSRYFTITFLISWSIWLIATLIGVVNSIPSGVLVAIGGIGPFAATMLLLFLAHTPVQRREYWQRVLDWRRIPLWWFGIILLLPAAVVVAAGGIEAVISSGRFGVSVERDIQDQPISLLPMAIFLFFFGPLPEELGWRGYALPSLQQRYSAFVASLLLGVVWAAWHVPYFLIDGTYQSDLGFGSAEFAFFMLNIVSQSFVYTWIFNNTQYSTLSAILFHFATNYTGEVLATTTSLEPYIAACWLVMLIVAANGLRQRASNRSIVSRGSWG